MPCTASVGGVAPWDVKRIGSTTFFALRMVLISSLSWFNSLCAASSMRSICWAARFPTRPLLFGHLLSQQFDLDEAGILVRMCVQEADALGCGPVCREELHHRSDASARPGPVPELDDALFVDRNDRDRLMVRCSEMGGPEVIVGVFQRSPRADGGDHADQYE